MVCHHLILGWAWLAANPTSAEAQQPMRPHDAKGDSTMCKTNLQRAIVTAACLLNLVATVGQASPPQQDWEFTDVAGQTHAPFEDQTTRAVVLVFISVDCPIANAYQPLLKKLARQHADQGVRWFMIHPHSGTTPERATTHARQFEIEVPIVVDPQQTITRRVGARVTPEVLVFAAGEKEAAYQGRIDNLHAGFGKKRAAATTHELADALQAIVDGQPIQVKRTEPIGCFIAFEDTVDEFPTDNDSLQFDDTNVVAPADRWQQK